MWRLLAHGPNIHTKYVQESLHLPRSPANKVTPSTLLDIREKVKDENKGRSGMGTTGWREEKAQVYIKRLPSHEEESNYITILPENSASEIVSATLSSPEMSGFIFSSCGTVER